MRIAEKDPRFEENLTEMSEMLYGLIHARFILTSDGMKQMVQNI